MSAAAFLRTRYASAFRTRAEVEAHQARGMARFRREVMPRSPFYRPLAGAPLEALPRMTKPDLMEAFTRINTCGIDRERAFAVAFEAERSRDFSPMIGDVAVGLSTGTSGQRGLFLATPRERRLWAAILAGRYWPSLVRRQRVAFFMRADNPLYRSLSNPLLRFEFFDLLAPFEEHLPRLAELDPTVLIAPAQMLGLLAAAQEAGLPRIAPARVISVAETLAPGDRAAVASAFGRSVDEVYQATEGVLAFTCPAGRLHLNERWLRVDRDVIDEGTGAFCPVVHDFTRESLPILNYRLDDVLIPDPRPCPCGCASARLLRIEGREDDMLWWPGEGGRRLVTAEAIRTTIAGLSVAVRDWRVIDRGDRLEVWLAGVDDAAAARAGEQLAVRLRALGQRLSCTPPPLDVRPGLPPEIDAKRRRIVARRDGDTLRSGIASPWRSHASGVDRDGHDRGAIRRVGS